MTRILIIDDSRSTAKILERILLGAGYDTRYALSGAEGLEQAARIIPDLILLDVDMPEMNGYEVCTRLKESAATRDIPIMFISAMGNEHKGLQLGAVDYIRKPFNKTVLQARIKNHLELKRYRDSLENQVTMRTRELEIANERLHREIEVRREAEIRARRNEERYRSVFENTGAATMILDPDLGISMVNAESSRWTGIPPEELTGRRFSDFIIPEDRDRVVGLHSSPSGDRALSTRYECRMRFRPDTTHTVLVRVGLIPETEKCIVSLIDITDRKRYEAMLAENEAYLRTVTEAIQTGLLVIDPETDRITDANPRAARMIGCEIQNLIGKSYRTYVHCEEDAGDPGSCQDTFSCDCILERMDGERIHVRKSHAGARLKDGRYIVQSLQDITDMKQMLSKQEINIELSRGILELVNRVSPRHTLLNESRSLFFDAFSAPCYKQGGDHFFLRNINPGQPASIITLKDQSGHEVGCVLRSIITDLFHHAILTHFAMPLEQAVSRLNQEICRSGTFGRDDFFTSVFLQIDHENMEMRYLSAGHPPFLFIRDGKARVLPATDEDGGNLPIGVFDEAPFQSGRLSLRVGDRIILYTDGLTEMPERNWNRTITDAELVEMVDNILREDPGMPVSVITERLVADVTALADETVTDDPVNTSDDDITLLLLEIESPRMDAEQCFTAADKEDLAARTRTVFERIRPRWDALGFADAETRLWTVLEEGVMNAWKHGNQEDRTKSVSVAWRFGNDFHLSISNEGDGFAPERIADPSAEENLLKTSGRGIFLIRYFSDSVRWENGGRRMNVTLSKRSMPTADAFDEKTGEIMKLWAME